MLSHKWSEASEPLSPSSYQYVMLHILLPLSLCQSEVCPLQRTEAIPQSLSQAATHLAMQQFQPSKPDSPSPRPAVTLSANVHVKKDLHVDSVFIANQTLPPCPSLAKLRSLSNSGTWRWTDSTVIGKGVDSSSCSPCLTLCICKGNLGMNFLSPEQQEPQRKDMLLYPTDNRESCHQFFSTAIAEAHSYKGLPSHSLKHVPCARKTVKDSLCPQSC